MRLRALQVVVGNVEAQASDAAFEGTVAGAIAEGTGVACFAQWWIRFPT